jgi:uncharacterized protein (TIGR02466 family)
MFGVYPLFPIPVGKIKYPHHEVFKQKVLDFMEKNKNDEEVDSNHLSELTHFFNSPDLTKKLFDCIEDKEFESFLIESGSIFVKHVMGYDIDENIILTDCWLNNCYKNGYQISHSHANSFISGTYYINYDSQKHSKLKFLNPFLNFHAEPYFQLNIREFTEFNQQETICDFIEEGDLILWSSHLDHGYDINMDDGRITMSMNFIPSKLKSGPYTFKIQV